MILTRRTPHLRANNYLHSLKIVVDDNVDAEITIKQFLQKMKLIVSIHESVLLNVEARKDLCYQKRETIL
jgi:hypothetical protein